MSAACAAAGKRNARANDTEYASDQALFLIRLVVGLLLANAPPLVARLPGRDGAEAPACGAERSLESTGMAVIAGSIDLIARVFEFLATGRD